MAEGHTAAVVSRGRLLSLVLACAAIGWLTIDGPVTWAIEGIAVRNGLTADESRWLWRLLAVAVGFTFAQLAPRWRWLGPPATELFDLPALLWGFGTGGGNLWVLAVELRAQWVVFALAGAVLAWLRAKRRQGMRAV